MNTIDYTKELTVPLGKIDYNGDGRKTHPVELEICLRELTGDRMTVDHKPATDPFIELSICLSVWMPSRRDIVRGGQAKGVIPEFFSGRADLARILEIWDRWHMNGMRAGCVHQEEDAKDLGYDYGKCKDLECPEGYKYGSQWLREPVPDEVLAELFEIAEALTSA